MYSCDIIVKVISYPTYAHPILMIHGDFFFVGGEIPPFYLILTKSIPQLVLFSLPIILPVIVLNDNTKNLYKQ